jgi:hypothetical protein
MAVSNVVKYYETTLFSISFKFLLDNCSQKQYSLVICQSYEECKSFPQLGISNAN